jgi:hypothetical protein
MILEITAFKENKISAEEFKNILNTADTIEVFYKLDDCS